MRTAVFLMLLSAVAFAGNSCSQNNRLILERGRQNKFYFTPGTLAGSGEPTFAGGNSQNYGYSFSGLPSWLSVEGNRVSGTPPSSGDIGPWTVTAKYTGNRGGDVSGSSSFLLSLSDALPAGVSLSGLSNVAYYENTSLNGNQLANDQAGCYVLLIPVIGATSTAPTQVATSVSTVAATVVSCTSQESSYNSAKQSVSAIQNEIAGYSSQLTSAQAAVETLRNKRDALQNQASTDNGAGFEGQLSTANAEANSISQQLDIAKRDSARATQNIASAQAALQTA